MPSSNPSSQSMHHLGVISKTLAHTALLSADCFSTQRSTNAVTMLMGRSAHRQKKMMYTYRELQERIIERRKLQQRSAAAESSAGERVGTAEDLAAKLCAFASDGIVVKHLIEFALPAKQRAEAVEVTEDTKAPEKLDVTLSHHTAKKWQTASSSSLSKSISSSICRA